MKIVEVCSKKSSVHIEWIVLFSLFTLSLFLIVDFLENFSVLSSKYAIEESVNEIVKRIEKECGKLYGTSYGNSYLFLKVIDEEKLKNFTCRNCMIEINDVVVGSEEPAGINIYVRKFPVLFLRANGTLSVEEMVIKIW